MFMAWPKRGRGPESLQCERFKDVVVVEIGPPAERTPAAAVLMCDLGHHHGYASDRAIFHLLGNTMAR